LPLSEIKQKIQGLKAPQEESSEANYTQRLSQIGLRLKRSAVWEDPKKRTKLEKLLSQLDELVEVE